MSNTKSQSVGRNTEKNGTTLFAFSGERAESEEGVNSTDIDIIMKQLRVDRNTAVKALKSTGDVVDAMLEISNK